jgi:hypothetical protein
MGNGEWKMENEEWRENGRGQNDQAIQEGQSQEQGSNDAVGIKSGGFQNSLLGRNSAACTAIVPPSYIKFGEFVMEPLSFYLTCVNVVNRIYVPPFLSFGVIDASYFPRVNSTTRSTVAKSRLL